MEIEQLEQIAAVIVTAGLVADNFLMFTPWRNGNELRQSHLAFLNPQKGAIHPLKFDQTVLDAEQQPLYYYYKKRYRGETSYVLASKVFNVLESLIW